MGIFSRIFGPPDPVKQAQPVVDKVNALEADFENLSREELLAKTRTWQEEIGKLKNEEETAEYLDQILPEAFAAVREAAKRTLGQRHYDVQVAGAVVLHEGKIAEMKTGEGKTLASTMPVYLNALTSRGAHVVTVNDYLARRDASWMGQIYHFLGLSIGSIQHDAAFLYKETGQPDELITEEEAEGVQVDVKNMVKVSRKEAYDADITYGTNNEFGFDYLRDNMARHKSQLVQRKLHYAIVDEVDSILIDEARTPLIISAPDIEGTELYGEFARALKGFGEEDFVVDEKHKQASFTDTGYEKLEQKYGQEIHSDIKLKHHANAALRAHTLFKKDRDYVVRDGEVVIVDEFTGRLMPGRRYSEGLHQAIEAKEGAQVQQESKTLATITFQNFFRLYDKLAGMTGTALTEAEEFHKIYSLDVAEVPTNKPVVRKDLADSVYKNESGKFTAIVREVKRRQDQGQPVLIGTISIEKNEYLSKLLQKAGVKHEVLNAKNHEKEAEIIAQAGRSGAVTLATNIAGRGVDIILGGNPPDEKEHEKVKKAGGLHVLGTERHESRRIDNQLRGRSGRQGDPGSSQFFLSLEDDLMRLFGGERLQRMMETLKVPEDQPIEHGMVSRSIENAQKKIEGMNFDIRKHVLEFDDVLNRQRVVIYKKRRKILVEEVNLKDQVLENIFDELEGIVLTVSSEYPPKKQANEIYKAVGGLMPVSEEERKALETMELWINHLTKLAEKLYEQKEEEVGTDLMRQIERMLTLQSIDQLWMEHLDTMDHLRQSVRLRGYAQKDPLVEYKRDGKRMFEQLLQQIDKTVVYTIFRVSVKPEEQAAPQQVTESRGSVSSTFQQNPQAQQSQVPAGPGEAQEKIGRNDPCPCGSGKKWKKCGLKNTQQHQQLMAK